MFIGRGMLAPVTGANIIVPENGYIAYGLSIPSMLTTMQYWKLTMLAIKKARYHIILEL